MKRILFIMLDYFTDTPRAIRTRRMADYLTNKYEVHILTLTNSNKNNLNYHNSVIIHEIENSWFRKFNNLNKNISSSQDINVTKAKWNYQFLLSTIKNTLGRLCLPLLYPDRYILDYFVIRKHLRLLVERYGFDYVIGSAYPHSIYMYGKYLKKNKNKLYWIVDLGDPLYLNAQRQGKLLTIFDKWYERKYLLFMDAVIVTNILTRDSYYHTFKSISMDKIYIVRQGGDVLHNIEKYKSLHYTNNLKMIYAGIFYPGLREPDNLFKAILADENPAISLDIYGSVDEKYKISCSNYQNKIQYKGTILHESLLKHYLKYHTLVFIDNAQGIQTPGKIFELLLTRKPILFIYSNEHSETLHLVRNIPTVIIAYNTVSDIKKAIRTICDTYHELIPDEYNYENFSWEKRAEEFRTLLESVSQKNINFRICKN